MKLSVYSFSNWAWRDVTQNFEVEFQVFYNSHDHIEKWINSYKLLKQYLEKYG